MSGAPHSISRRGDVLRLLCLVPLLVLAAVGKGRQTVDVENLAMKSVGTVDEELAALRREAFGDEPRLILLCTPRAPELYSAIDEADVEAYVEALRALPEVDSLAETATKCPGERVLSVAVATDDQGRWAEAVEGIVAFARAKVPPTWRLAVGGVPAVEVEIAREMAAERSRILPIILVALSVVLLIVYRSPVLVAGALLAPLTGVFLLDGLQGLAGLTIDPVSALLGPSILTVGVASSVHVLERYRHTLARTKSVVLASAQAAHELRTPMLLTVATTVAGFLGLLASPIPAVKRFGVLASVGMVLAVAVTLLCLPSLLRLLHRPAPGATRAMARADLLHPLLLHRWAGFVVAGAVLVSAAAGLFLLDTGVDSDPLRALAADSAVRRDAATLAERLGGNEVFELLLTEPGPASPVATAALVSAVSGLDGVVGPAAVPQRSASGHQLLAFLLERDLGERREGVFSRAAELARDQGWSQVGVTGLSVRIARDSVELVRGQRRGILATLAVLWVVMAIGFRSFGLALLGLVPNVLPVLLIQGTLGAIERPLSVASSMTAAVMLGLVVDDTIHLLHAYRGARGRPLRRMARALHHVKRPIVITTVVLCVGFSATAMGELDATREFGALAVATLVIALIADLILLPALLLWERPSWFRLRTRGPTCIEHPTTTS